MKKLIFLFFLLIFLISFAEGTTTSVLVVNVDKPITQATVELIKESLKEKPDVIILTLDTTGGELTSTFNIMRLIEQSEIPFIGYVYPKGAKAWSAGTFILLSMHIAAMSPYAVIGSSQPISIGLDSMQMVNESKIINALVAFMEERMRMHNRNVSVVKKFITENLNLNEEQAKQSKVIEIVANDIPDLLNKIDGTKVKTSKGEILINTKNPEISYYEPSLKVSFMSLISDPIVASLLLMIGIYALIFGFSHPGVGSEILGVLLIILGIISLGFDVNLAGIIMILVGAGLILFELTTPGFGLFGILGVITLVIGVIFIGPLTSPNWYISKEFQETLFFAIVAPAVIFGLFLLFALFKIAEVKFKKPVIGDIIGEKAKSVDEIDEKKEGFVLYKGELWKAKSRKEKIKKDEEVKIVGKEESLLVVDAIEKK